jgi:flagellar biosynthesis anti-sigma factor FlgM
MKVDPKNTPGVTGETRSITPPPTRPAQAAGAGAVRKDQVELSSRAETFRKVRPQLDAMPDADRKERVARLRELIAQGQYEVSGEKIADAVVQDEKTAELLGIPPAR